MITFTDTAQGILRKFHDRGYTDQAITLHGDEVTVTLEGEAVGIDRGYDCIENSGRTLTVAARLCEQEWSEQEQYNTAIEKGNA